MSLCRFCKWTSDIIFHMPLDSSGSIPFCKHAEPIIRRCAAASFKKIDDLSTPTPVAKGGFSENAFSKVNSVPPASRPRFFFAASTSPSYNELRALVSRVKRAVFCGTFLIQLASK